MSYADQLRRAGVVELRDELNKLRLRVIQLRDTRKVPYTILNAYDAIRRSWEGLDQLSKGQIEKRVPRLLEILHERMETLNALLEKVEGEVRAQPPSVDSAALALFLSAEREAVEGEKAEGV